VKKSASMLVLLLFLSFVLFSLPQIGVVKAESTIYIRADGSVEGTDKIQRDGDFYTFISDISGSIVLERDNAFLDGSGYRLQGDGNQNGITLRDNNNITVRNLKLSSFNIGIVVMGSDNNKILENTITDNFRGLDFTASENNFVSKNYIANNDDGIALENIYNTISENTITNNRDSGIHLYGAGHNIIYRNEVSSNGFGIDIVRSENNTIYGNSLMNNGFNINIDDAGNNLFFDNNLTSYVGNTFRFTFARNNTFHHNNFAGRIEVVDRGWLLPPWIPNSSINIWDDGIEGNYWEDYNGSDGNGDGIGDNPYLIHGSNVDNYPLMEPVIIPEFPSWIILPLLLTATLVAIICKKRLPKILNQQSY